MSPSSARTTQQILGPKAVAELFTPARLEVYESLQVAGPASVAELAARLGRAPDSLYYHLRKLVGIGVVARRAGAAAGRGDPGRNGAVYEVTAKSVTMRLNPASRPSREAWSGGAASVLRLVARDVGSALTTGAPRTEGKQRNLLVQRVKVRLKPAELTRVNALLDELSETLRAHSQNTAGELFAVTLAMSPLEERTRN